MEIVQTLAVILDSTIRLSVPLLCAIVALPYVMVPSHRSTLQMRASWLTQLDELWGGRSDPGTLRC